MVQCTPGPPTFGLETTALASMGTRKIEQILMDYVTANEKKYADSYLQTTVKVVKSWLNHNNVELRHKIKIMAVNETPSLKEERVPRKRRLAEYFYHQASRRGYPRSFWPTVV